MNIDYFRMLYDYNDWANARVFARAEELTDAEYRSPHPGLAYVNVHGCLVHTIAGEVMWLGRWKGETIAARLTEADLPVLEAVRDCWHDVAAAQIEFLAGLSDADLERPVALPGPAGATAPLTYALGHPANHGTQFRAEAAVALTAMGHSPGNLDLGIYLAERTI